MGSRWPRDGPKTALVASKSVPNRIEERASANLSSKPPKRSLKGPAGPPQGSPKGALGGPKRVPKAPEPPPARPNHDHTKARRNARSALNPATPRSAVIRWEHVLDLSVNKRFLYLQGPRAFRRAGPTRAEFKASWRPRWPPNGSKTAQDDFKTG